MVPKEDVIALVVESDGTAPAELRLVVEQRSQHAAHSETYTCAEVVQNYLQKKQNLGSSK